MAANSHSRVGSRTSLGNGSGVDEQELPLGSCNFRDLSIGLRTQPCGCQRFWLNSSYQNGQSNGSERAWCFCGHHACFHDAFSQALRMQEQSAGDIRMTGAEDLENGTRENVPAHQAATTPVKPLTGLGIRPEPRSPSQSINTLVWQALNDFARNQADEGMSDAGSKLPSTAAPSVVDESQRSLSRMIQGQGQGSMQHYRTMGPPVNIPQGPLPKPTEDYSATEVNTPSIAGTPDFRALASSSNQSKISPGHIRPGNIDTQTGHQETAAVGPIQTGAPPVESTVQQQRPSTYRESHLSAHEMRNIIRAYGNRLDALESLSFSYVPIEEVQEKFEHLEGRILDLEHWRADQESREAGRPPSSKRRRLLSTEPGSFGSDWSFDRNAAAHTEAAVLATLAANAETHPRIDALESRVADLESMALPSFSRPWQVQVVLLPWGPELRGIWFSAAEATQHSLRTATQASDEWTGAQSAPKLSFKSSATGAWTTESIQAWAYEAQEWLSPKACGPSGTVFQRLASRGLVRDVEIAAFDSRHILDTIRATFNTRIADTSNVELEQAAQYQALQESFIPLRKVRKSSRLRFLSPAEMITSATWTAGFLDSSVFMKLNDGQKRLYVTSPEAYLQRGSNGWCWGNVQELSVDKTSTTSSEACWTYHEQLDRLPSIHSSVASHESKWSTRSQMADYEAEASERRPISPRSDSRPPRQRTVSLPSSSSAAEMVKEAIPTRRVRSFGTPATLAIHADESGVDVVAKRRRISVSPEAERRGVNFTPRWSREPPSPFTSEAAAEARSQGANSRKRGATPSAYATPHSNSNLIGRMEFIPGDGDTEVATDILADYSDRGEEEWEGVEDGDTNAQSDDEHAVDGDGIGENDIDE